LVILNVNFNVASYTLARTRYLRYVCVMQVLGRTIGRCRFNFTTL